MPQAFENTINVVYGDDIVTGKTAANGAIMIHGLKANDYRRLIVIMYKIAVVQQIVCWLIRLEANFLNICFT